jgi:hypothetical protein
VVRRKNFLEKIEAAESEFFEFSSVAHIIHMGHDSVNGADDQVRDKNAQ